MTADDWWIIVLHSFATLGVAAFSVAVAMLLCVWWGKDK